jgi:hypothetical protein
VNEYVRDPLSARLIRSIGNAIDNSRTNP